MSMTTAELKRLAHSEYWDERYAEVGPNEQVHEWFRSFSDLQPFLDQHLFQVRKPETSPRILHLGSGDSTIPEDLAKLGYKNQLCVDFSTVVVQAMSIKHRDIEGITWKQADVRCMNQIPSESVDVAFDKGTLDAMIYGSPWDPPDEVLDNTGRYIREVFRVLKPTGTFIYVSYRQPHFLKPLLNCQGVEWDMKIDILGGSGSSFDYSGFVLNKVPRKSAELKTDKVASG
ncbi:hypothetical protein PV10_02689 [Exophiala mesophila]|uniref:Methyltransferase type 11 domain-containing protein n=1 Tax=Exophiala mesophila TaxID=212818 RepID=A0A0D1ZM33_EXOME|nr:uncharacterized protein PV10_02689 [Exophiala mesophila]KIV94979.1 hypothetical protein PV10_02689 [Exophiala mesophila]